MSAGGFDPASLREREQQLAARLAAAIRRIGDARVADRVARTLAGGEATELFALFADEDRRVITAAHECAMLRYAYIVAIVARAFGFDGYARDDLVQRTFLDLPRVVARARARGASIPNPEGWLRYRAYLTARQMLRDERGGPVRDRDTGAVRRDAEGRIVRTRGRAVPLESVEGARDADELLVIEAIADEADHERLDLALRALEQEQPLWAEIIRLHYYDGYRLDEVAKRLGRAHGTVRNDALKARARLEAIIRSEHPALAPSQGSHRGGADVVR